MDLETLLSHIPADNGCSYTTLYQLVIPCYSMYQFHVYIILFLSGQGKKLSCLDLFPTANSLCMNMSSIQRLYNNFRTTSAPAEKKRASMFPYRHSTCRETELRTVSSRVTNHHLFSRVLF